MNLPDEPEIQRNAGKVLVVATTGRYKGTIKSYLSWSDLSTYIESANLLYFISQREEICD